MGRRLAEFGGSDGISRFATLRFYRTVGGNQLVPASLLIISGIFMSVISNAFKENLMK